MSRTLVFALLAIAGVLAAAAGLRARDAPYIAYADGNRLAALDGLQHKAEAGDGFAAYLVGNGYRDGLKGERDPQAATGWYMHAVRAGEIRAIGPYIGIVAQQSPSAAACQTMATLLDLAGRAGDPGSLLMLGHFYETGLCVDVALNRAAGYYAAAERIDRRLGDQKKKVLAQIEATGKVPPPTRLEQNGFTTDQALARFLAEAPLLPAETPQ